MKVSHVIASLLAKHGIKCVFGFQGGSVTHLIDSISRNSDIRYIQTYNEQGAAFAADAYARVSNDGIGVALATNGPGATNLITGIANAYCDSVPTLFLTGQVHSYSMKNSDVRQESFQEIDICSVVKPITKYCVTVRDKDEVLSCLVKGINIAKSNRPGPVLIDIPVDIQGSDIDDYDSYFEEITECTAVRPSNLYELCGEIVNMLDTANAPLILLGGGVEQKITNTIQYISENYEIPVVTSLMGIDKVRHDSPLFVGFIGTYGNRYANLAIQNSDLLIVVGSRLDQRQTGKNKLKFAPKAKVVHVDIDSSELKHFIREDISILSDSKSFFLSLKESLVSSKFEKKYSKWNKQIIRWKELYDSTSELTNINGINPNQFMKELGLQLHENVIVCSDVGQNQMWVAQSLRVKADYFRLLNSGGLGAMGYSLPASIGAYFANKQSKVVAIMGDGGLQMNIQELQLLRQYSIPITVVIMNNHSLGMIRDIHKKYYDCNFEGSVHGFSVPPLEKIADAYGLAYFCISSEQDFQQINQIIASSKPYLVDVELQQDTRVSPELIGFNSLDQQQPIKVECEESFYER